MSFRRDLENLLAKTVTDEGGQPLRPRVIPLYSQDNADTVRARILAPGTPLAPEIEDLVRLGAGVQVGHLEIRWDGNVSGQYLDDAFPSACPVMGDGFGNSWSVDVDVRTGIWGPVYFLCHDPPVVVFQAESFGRFLEQAASAFDPDGPINRVHEQAAMNVWTTGGRMVPLAQAHHDADRVLSRAISAAPRSSWIADLRSAQTGDGFPWGKFGPHTHLVRPLPEPIFVVSSGDA